MKTLRLNIARLSAATYTNLLDYMRMPLWQLLQVMEDVEQTYKKR